MMSRLLRALRGHLHFLVIVPALIVVMTYPTIRYVFDTEVFWLPTIVYDAWTNIWNAWYAELILAGKAELLHTDLMFYPEGVSLAFHSYSLPHVVTLNALSAILPLPNAYNLTYLLIIFVATLSAYIYLLYLFRLKWVCLLGAIIFGCSIYVTARPSQPLVTTIATIPLSLYFFHRAVLEKRWSLAALSGFLAGATAFVGIYTYVCLLIALGLYILYFALMRWRQRAFWMTALLALAMAGFIGLARVYPMLADSPALEQALGKGGGEELNTDLVHFFVNYDHPVMTPVFRQLFGLETDTRWSSSYLGYLPLALIVIGLLRQTYRRKMLFWLYLMIPFLALRLGSRLTINDQEFSDILLPKHFLDELLPSVFEAIYAPDYFHSGALLPLAVLSCYGALTLLRFFSQRYRWPLIVLLILGVAFENYNSLEHVVIPDEQLALLDWLAEEDDQQDIRLINVPMGRVNAKLYDFYQTLSGYPHAEGVAGRTPQAAYDYINNNPLLSRWSANKSIHCRLSNQSQYLAALDALLRDGFTHIVMHPKAFFASKVEDSFAFAEADFQNEYAAVYRLVDLRGSCPEEMPGHEAAAHLKEFFSLPAPLPKRNESILSLHSHRLLGPKLFRFYTRQAAKWKSLIHIAGDAREQIQIQSSDARSSDKEGIVNRNSIVWLVYDPQETDPRSVPVYNDWFVKQYRRCNRAHNSFHIRVDLYIRRLFSCDLVAADASLSVRYENGIQLANRLYNVSENELRVFLWWSEPRGGDHAYSIQIFDSDGLKVAQADHVIRYDPLAYRHIDISQLPAGAYSARLIVYHVDSKQSQPGTIMQNQHSFLRELEIAHFSVDA
ncbi:MAG: hypothetical protein OXT68_03895 [Chloroflexota bacterium]|nr:hypothetical protein [Chloroflexota bacterium]